jgi:hypothetical protein
LLSLFSSAGLVTLSWKPPCFYNIYNRAPFLLPFSAPHSPSTSAYHHPSLPQSLPCHSWRAGTAEPRSAAHLRLTPLLIASKRRTYRPHSELYRPLSRQSSEIYQAEQKSCSPGSSSEWLNEARYLSSQNTGA